jgi:GDPmannose 4,6-dehydratase
MVQIVSMVRPREVYHLAAQSHVKVSFEIAEYTGDVTGIGTVRVLEAIRLVDPTIRFYNVC